MAIHLACFMALSHTLPLQEAAPTQAGAHCMGKMRSTVPQQPADGCLSVEWQLRRQARLRGLAANNDWRATTGGTFGRRSLL